MIFLKSLILLLLEVTLVPLIKVLDFLYHHWGFFPATRAMLKRFYYRQVRLFFYNF